jgi:hypothetical protein
MKAFHRPGLPLAVREAVVHFGSGLTVILVTNGDDVDLPPIADVSPLYTCGLGKRLKAGR